MPIDSDAQAVLDQYAKFNVPDADVSRTSLYTQASLRPLVTGLGLVGAGLALAAMWRSSQDGATTRRGVPRRRDDDYRRNLSGRKQEQVVSSR